MKRRNGIAEATPFPKTNLILSYEYLTYGAVFLFGQNPTEKDASIHKERRKIFILPHL